MREAAVAAGVRTASGDVPPAAICHLIALNAHGRSLVLGFARWTINLSDGLSIPNFDISGDCFHAHGGCHFPLVLHGEYLPDKVSGHRQHILGVKFACVFPQQGNGVIAEGAVRGSWFYKTLIHVPTF